MTVLDDGRVVAGSKYGLAIKEDWGWRNIVETTTSAVIVHDSFNYNFYAADTIPVDFEITGNFLGYIKFKRAISLSNKMLNFDKESIKVVKGNTTGTIKVNGTLTIVGLANEFF